jgi:hypothetical protein
MAFWLWSSRLISYSLTIMGMEHKWWPHGSTCGLFSMVIARLRTGSDTMDTPRVNQVIYPIGSTRSCQSGVGHTKLSF